MDKIWGWLRKWAFVEGLAVGMILCHLFYHEFRIDEIKDRFDAKEQALDSQLQVKATELDALQALLTKAEQYEQKYVAESSRALLLERRLADATIDYEATSQRFVALVNEKWEEKYNAERLTRISLDEELAGLRKRNEVAEAGQATADPYLVKQVEALTEQNRILSRERDELRKLYVTPAKVVLPSAGTPTPFPVEALSGVMGTDAGDTIVGIMQTLQKPVEVASFIAALGKAMTTDRAAVVKACAPALAYPLTSQQMKAISGLVMATDSGETMQLLLKEQAKH